MKSNKIKSALALGLPFAAILLFCGVVAAQGQQVKGVISGRNGATLTVQTQDSGNVVVILNFLPRWKTYQACFMLARSRWA